MCDSSNYKHTSIIACETLLQGIGYLLIVAVALYQIFFFFFGEPSLAHPPPFELVCTCTCTRRLTGSDHRRNVRPKFRQQASTTHLKILRNREGVTTEMPTDDPSALDPNTYSTYMGNFYLKQWPTADTNFS